MMGDLVRALVQGYTAPRLSMRRILAGGHGHEVALLLVAAAYLIQSFLTILILPGRFGLAGHVMAIVQQLATFFLFSALVVGIGRLAGGRGTMLGAELVVGWHALVTSLISPLALGFTSAVITAAANGAGAISPGMAVLGFVYLGISFWLLANYVAELHGFRSTWNVLGAIIVLIVACAFLVMAILRSFMSA